MKKVLVIIGLCFLAGFLVFAVAEFQGSPQDEVCTGFEVVLSDDNTDTFVNPAHIEAYVREQGLHPAGRYLKEINTSKIEDCIRKNQLIGKAVVYITNSGKIIAEIHERRPILRVMNSAGENYYIDNNGERMPLSGRFTAYLPIATGTIKEELVKNELYKFALFLHNDKFWDAQIEQIVVMPNQEIQLIPRVGDHIIVLGKLDGFEEKLDKLMTFYQRGLDQMGWNKYSAINLKFDKQVVCTKR